jgi:hypothetical protein
MKHPVSRHRRDVSIDVHVSRSVHVLKLAANNYQHALCLIYKYHDVTVVIVWGSEFMRLLRVTKQTSV